MPIGKSTAVCWLKWLTPEEFKFSICTSSLVKSLSFLFAHPKGTVVTFTTKVHLKRL
jgi:hypothetical protein